MVYYRSAWVWQHTYRYGRERLCGDDLGHLVERDILWMIL